MSLADENDLITREDFRGVDAFDVEVGLTIRHFRSTRRVSQAELASALGVSSQQVRSFERGAERMSAAILVRAANRLKVSPEDLLPSSEFSAAADTEIDLACSGAARMHMTSPRHRQAVLDLIQALQP
jgi:transcriptional regulator with XRE-family HTH domain